MAIAFILGVAPAIFIIAGIMLLIVLSAFVSMSKPWVQAYMSGAPISILELFGMNLRRVKTNIVVPCRIMACQAGYPLSIQELEKAYLSGANVVLVTRAYVEAKKQGKEFSFEELVDANLSDNLEQLLSS